MFAKLRNKLFRSAVFKIALTSLVVIAAFLGGLIVGNKFLPSVRDSFSGNNTAQKFQDFFKEQQAISESVAPASGLSTKIVLGDAVMKLVENKVIDRKKLDELYSDRGGLTDEQKAIFEQSSVTPITINASNAQFWVNILWGIGLANKSAVLTESPAADPENLFNLASTGGWILGEKDNGGYYYNQFEIVKLTAEQDELVKRIAQNIYRPCCGNSTAFPDCNHGAAILGMLELGAAQGLSEQELYEEALKFNIYWFPDQYTKIATLFRIQDDKPWSNVDPRIVLGNRYSSGLGFRKNVEYSLARFGGFMPNQGGGGGCSA